jgi:hypothetical protein
VNTGPRAQRTLDIAARVLGLLRGEGIDAALIGSVALAIHGFVRATRDIDLAVIVSPVPVLERVAAALRADGLTAHVSAPAPDDDLGGVITVEGEDFDPVQLVNFFNPPFRTAALPREAVATASAPAGFPLPVVDLPHLIALKLATGAFRDEVDVGDLLEVRPDAELDAIREVCGRFNLSETLQRVMARIGRG